MSKDRKYDLEDRLIDFAIRKMKISLKELRETRIWLLMIVKGRIAETIPEVKSLIAENNELISIFVASIDTARANNEST